MRRLVLIFLALVLLVLAPVHGQITDGTTIGNLDQDRARTKKIRDARQVINDYPDERWRRAAYLVVELTPHEDGSTAVSIAERDRGKLPGVKKSEQSSETLWRVPGGSRVWLLVNYYQAQQEVACSVPKKLRGKPVSLGIFPVYESQIECFVRERAQVPPAPAP